MLVRENLKAKQKIKNWKFEIFYKYTKKKTSGESEKLKFKFKKKTCWSAIIKNIPLDDKEKQFLYWKKLSDNDKKKFEWNIIAIKKIKTSKCENIKII